MNMKKKNSQTKYNNGDQREILEEFSCIARKRCEMSSFISDVIIITIIIIIISSSSSSSSNSSSSSSSSRIQNKQ